MAERFTSGAMKFRSNGVGCWPTPRCSIGLECAITRARRCSFLDLAVDPRAATTPAGFPVPIGPKAAPMPPDRGLGLDHRDRIQNGREASVQPDEDQPIDVPQPHPRSGLAAQNDHLLTQNQVFSLEARP